MKIKQLRPLTVLLALLLGLPALATHVRLSTGSSSLRAAKVTTLSGETIEIGEKGTDKFYEFDCAEGEYLITIFNPANDSVYGSIQLAVEGEEQEITTQLLSCQTSDVSVKLGVDYDIPFDRIQIMSQNGEIRKVFPGVVSTKVRDLVYVPIMPYDSYIVCFVPIGDKAGLYGEVIESGTIGRVPSGLFVDFLPLRDITFTIPADASLYVGQKPGNHHYVPFTEFYADSEEEIDGNKEYRFRVSDGAYNYRISRPGDMTMAGLIYSSDFDENGAYTVTVTDEQLSAYSSQYFNHDTEENGQLNYADIYLNINEAGHLRLSEGDSFQIVNLRTWQLTNSTTANYFLEPDYNYTVLNTDFMPDESVVSVDANGLLSAHKAGTAIVQVRYDAIQADAIFGGSVWSAICMGMKMKRASV